MKTLVPRLFVLALLPLSVSARAADMKLPVKAPPAPVAAPLAASPDWSGFYVGVNAGAINSDGGLVGGTAGYNFQTGPAVLGVEGDIDASWANRTAPYLDTVRGRFGYAIDQFMPYFTAGWAWGDHGGANGAALGGGIEVRLLPAVSMKLEYLHVRINGPDDAVRIGLNWRFNGLGSVLPGSPIATRY